MCQPTLRKSWLPLWDHVWRLKAVFQNRYNVLEATDGEEGLKTALTEQPDLVLLDMSLPKMDGFTVVRKIKEDQKGRHIPVIALTARAMKGDMEEMLEAGCDDYISKPIDPEKILAVIEKWLNFEG
jgi:CheY-like chemotaxis protein